MLFRLFFFPYKKRSNIGALSLVGTPNEAAANVQNGFPVRYRVVFPYESEIPKVVDIVYDDSLRCEGSPCKLLAY